MHWKVPWNDPSSNKDKYFIEERFARYIALHGERAGLIFKNIPNIFKDRRMFLVLKKI